MSCYRSSNNRFFNSPSKMADGRLFTDYRPNCEMNRYIESGNKIRNTHDYRLFLSRNAERLMDKNKEYIYMKNGMGNCMEPYHIGTMLPEKTRVVCDQHTCRVVDVDPNGHGQGREYVTEKSNDLLTPQMKPEKELDDNVCATALLTVLFTLFINYIIIIQVLDQQFHLEEIFYLEEIQRYF